MKLFHTGLIILLAGGLAGCDPASPGTNMMSDFGTMTGGDGAALSPEQKALRAREKSYAQARVGGAAAGAALAGGLCMALGGKTEQCLASAAVGGAAGYAAVSYAARRDASFRVSQQSLEADIRQARADNQTLQQNVSAAEKALAYQQSEAARLKAGLKSGAVSSKEAAARVGTMKGDLASVKTLQSSAENRLASLQNSQAAYARAGMSSGELGTQAQEQKAQIARLQRVQNAMVGVIDSVPVTSGTKSMAAGS